MLKRLLSLPTWATLALLAAALVVVSVTFSSLNPWNPLNFLAKPQPKIDIGRAAVVRQIRDLNRLETKSYTIEKVIEAGNDGNAFQDLLYGDRILLVAHGTVVAGVDLSSVKADDVSVSGQSLSIRLPSSQLFSASLDPDQTRVFDRKLGLLSKGDKDLESQARAAATSSIRQAACQDGILEQAASAARARLTAMYKLVGFSSVSISAPAGRCQ